MFARSAFRAAQPLKMVSLRSPSLPRGPAQPSLFSPASIPTSSLADALSLVQHARRYATEAGAKGGSSKALPIAVGVLALTGAGYYGLSGSPAAQEAESKVKQAVNVPAKPAFTGGDQGWVSLKLSDIELVNHNTKRLRFELPEPDNVSGLHVASAVLTKYKGPNDEKATLRPYTPISDEGEFLVS